MFVVKEMRLVVEPLTRFAQLPSLSARWHLLPPGALVLLLTLTPNFLPSGVYAFMRACLELLCWRVEFRDKILFLLSPQQYTTKSLF